MSNSLNNKEITHLISNLLIVKMIFAFPRNLFATSGNAAWIQAIYMSLIAWFLLEISFLFYGKTGKKTILQLAESTGKLPLKILCAVLITAVFAANVGSEMRTFAESVKVILLPKTPIEIIMLLFVATISYGGFCGLGALATVNAIFFPFCLFFLGVLVVSLLKNYDINTLLPIMGKGGKSIFLHGLKDLSCFSDILALNLILPYCDDISTAKNCARRGILTAAGVITLLCLACGMIYPDPFSSEFLLTTYQLTRMVRAGEYFQRFEALFEFVWAITQLLYSAIYVYLISKVLSDSFKLSYEKPLIPCVAAILAMLSFIPASTTEHLSLTGEIRTYLFPIAYLLPIIIPAIYIVAEKRRKSHE